MTIFGILHFFQREHLTDTNSIPTPSTPLEKYLDHFFVDFGLSSKEKRDSNNESIKINGETDITEKYSLDLEEGRGIPTLL